MRSARRRRRNFARAPFLTVIARASGQSSSQRACCVYWVPACARTTAQFFARPCVIRFSNSAATSPLMVRSAAKGASRTMRPRPVAILRDAALRAAPQDEVRKSQRSAARIDLVGPGVAAIPILRGPRKSTEGARDATGPKRTRRLRRLATPKRIKQPRFTLSRSAKGSASPPVPRRPARGVYRFAPRRFPVVERLRALRRLSTVEDQALGPAPSDGGRRPTGRQGPRPARRAGRNLRGLDRRAASPHLQRNVIPRPPLPAPCLKMLIRHPSVTRRDALRIIHLGLLSRAIREKFLA